MIEFIKTIVQIRNDRRGVTAMEYGLIAAPISAVLVTAVGLLTGGLTATFTRISGVLS